MNIHYNKSNKSHKIPNINVNYIKEIFREFDYAMKQQFQKKRIKGGKISPTKWTAKVLSTFNEMGKRPERDFTCDSSFTNGEYMFDLCWTTYPYYPENPRKYYTEFYKHFNKNLRLGPPQIVLSLESEWGDEDDHHRNRTLILDDFCKIRDAKSIIKVMVFGFHSKGVSTFDALINSMRELIYHPYYQSSIEYYLFYGISWNKDARKWVDVRKAKAFMFSNGNVKPVFNMSLQVESFKTH